MSQLPFPEKILQQHSATLGKTGAGKSSALRVMVEHQLDRKKRVCIVDPKGDWWGLKSSQDGKQAGYPVITFGNFKEPRATDVPINEQSGKHVAELIATGNRPCIIGFRGWMPAQMTKFWIDFASTLFNTNEGELYVYIDEVHNFAAKGKIMDPQAGKCLHWTNRIISEGRGLGMTFAIASQRAQKVHNDTLDCCETLLAMRVAHPAARKSIEDWINSNGDPTFGKEILSTMAQLKRGEAWVWSPENEYGPKRVQFPMFQTFDSFAPPQLQRKISESGWSEVDLDQVREKLATVIAEAKANDPLALKQQIAELRRKLAEVDKQPSQNIAPDPQAVERLVSAAIRPYQTKCQAASKQLQELISRINLQQSNAEAFTALMNRRMEEVRSELIDSNTTPMVHKIVPPPSLPQRVQPAAPMHSSNGSSGVGKAERAILTVLAVNGTSTKNKVAIFAGYAVNGGGFNNALGKCRSQRWLEGNDPYSITSAGLGALGNYSPLPTGQDLITYWQNRLPKAERSILTALIEAPEKALHKERIAEVTNYQALGGGFNSALGSLRTMELITGRDPISLCDSLMEAAELR